MNFLGKDEKLINVKQYRIYLDNGLVIEKDPFNFTKIWIEVNNLEIPNQISIHHAWFKSLSNAAIFQSVQFFNAFWYPLEKNELTNVAKSNL